MEAWNAKKGLWNAYPLSLAHWWEAFRYNGYTLLDEYRVQAPTEGLHNGLAGRAEPGDLDGYRVVLWDSGDLREFTLGYPGSGKAYDTQLLEHWLAGGAGGGGDRHLWLMGNAVAKDLGTQPFLEQILGVGYVFWDDYDSYTGILSPRVYATHPALEYLGGAPYFRLVGCCDNLLSRGYSIVSAVDDPLVEITHEWVDTGGLDIQAGILNFDPDGDGTGTYDGAHLSRALFNPFSYGVVRDEGYGLPAHQDYARLMVGHVLNNLFEHEPDAVG